MTTMQPAQKVKAPIAVALDTQSLDQAVVWATLVGPHVQVLKVGLQLYLRVGAAGVREIVAAAPQCDLFLDLKLHDIPNTVKGGALAVAELSPKYLTVHVLGGAAMVAAAAEALPSVQIAGVTILTSMSEADLKSVGIAGPASDSGRRLAALAVGAGARALVCSPMEVSAIRREVGEEITLVTPGVRPSTASTDDQARVATPEQAVTAGADLLVIGRPITAATDPARAAAEIARTLSSGA